MRTATAPLLSSKEQDDGAPPNFDRLASVYRWMEYLSFGPALSRCRMEFIGELSHSRNALVIGDGDGRFTVRLLDAMPDIYIDAIDTSPAMLRALMGRAGANASRVRTKVQDARTWQPANDPLYDLVVTHFFLDCLTTAEIHSLAAKILPASAPNALWVVSEFAIPQSWFGRLIAGPLVAALYRAFGLLTGLKVRKLPGHAAALHTTGFNLVARRTQLCGLLTSELWTCMRRGR